MKTSYRIINAILSLPTCNRKMKLKYCVKMHPVTHKYKTNIHKLICNNSSFEMVNDSFNDIMAFSDIMISSMSSCCLEALAYAVPCLIIGDENSINFNPIPEAVDNTAWRVCYTNKDISKTITDFSLLSKKSLDNIAEFVRDNYFSRVTKESVDNFINI